MGTKRGRDDRKARSAERRREQQERDRRQRRIVYGIAIPVALIIIGLVPFTNWYNAHQRGKKHAVGYTTKASAAAKSAGCTGVRNDRQIPTSIVSASKTVDYASLTSKAGNALPPTSGPRQSSLLPDTPAFYAIAKAPRPERAVNNLYHGYVVVWYDKKLPAADVKALQSAAPQNSRTLVVPWTRSTFPGNQHVVFTAWDRTQRCTTASPKALTEFVGTYGDDGSGKGWASPTAPQPSSSADASISPTAIPTGAQTSVNLPIPSGQATATVPVPTASTVPSTSPTASTATPRVTVSPVR